MFFELYKDYRVSQNILSLGKYGVFSFAVEKRLNFHHLQMMKNMVEGGVSEKHSITSNNPNIINLVGEVANI